MMLHDYQLVARDFLRGRPRAALFMEMGHGKTASVLTALRPADLPALVIAPKRVAENVWLEETALWRPDLHCVRVMGTPAQRAAALAQRADIYALGIENINDIARAYPTVVLDESSAYKGRGARFKRAKRITANARNVWELTGTPGDYMALWAQIYLLDGGQRLGRTYREYLERFFTKGFKLPTGAWIGQKLLPGADDIINELISDICLSIEGRVDVEKPSYNTIKVHLPASVRKQYEDIKKTLVMDLDLIGPVTAGNEAILSNKLTQIASGFVFTDEQVPVQLHKEKAYAAREVVDGTGSPILMAYRYRPEMEVLRSVIPEACTMDEPGIISRWNDGEVPVLLAHPQSIGHGLNLQRGGHTAVWASPTWSLEQWQQFNMRLPRQGQKHRVMIHSIIAVDTIEDKVMQPVLEGKGDVQQLLMDYLASPV